MDIGKAIDDLIGGACRWLLEKMYDNLYGVTENDSLFMPLDTALEGVYTFATGIASTVTGPIGYAILGACFAIGLYEALTRNGELLQGLKIFETIAVLLIGFIILKVVLDHAGLLMEYVYEIFDNVIVGIKDYEQGDALTYTSENEIDNIMASVEGNALAFFIPCLIAFLVSFLVSLAAQIVILLRYIELYIYLAMAPIPLSTLASPHTSDMGKGYLKNFAACAAQAAIIMLVVKFFPAVMGSTFANAATSGDALAMLGTPIIYSIVMLVAIFSSSAITRRALGIG